MLITIVECCGEVSKDIHQEFDHNKYGEYELQDAFYRSIRIGFAFGFFRVVQEFSSLVCGSNDAITVVVLPEEVRHRIDDVAGHTICDGSF